MTRRPLRKIIALVTAYALALTVLLPFLALATLPAGAGEFALAAICRGQQPGPAGDNGAPIGHGPACPCSVVCAMAACTGAAAAPAIAAVSERADTVVLATFPAQGGEIISIPERGRPQAARAPPV